MRNHRWIPVFVVAMLVPSAIASSAPKGGERKLFFSVAACWLGPVWSDAVGQPASRRIDTARASCDDVAATVWGSADHTHVLQLRAFEQDAVDDVAARLRGDPELYETYRSFALAQRENMLARRAADRVKLDIDGVRRDNKLTIDERDAIAPLRARAGTERLLASHQRDARALGLISAMDRMELTRGLTKPLKIYALADLYSDLFGVQVTLPASPTVRGAPGALLAFMSDAAAAAGHPVPATGTPRHRFAVAWGGVLEGFADQLRPEIDRVSPELQPVVQGIVRRLQAEYTGIRNGANENES